jgi:hypothetical protein
MGKYPCNPWIFQQQHTHTTRIKTYFHVIWSPYFIQSTVYRPLQHQSMWPGAPSAQFPQTSLPVFCPLCPHLTAPACTLHTKLVYEYVKGMPAWEGCSILLLTSCLHLPTCYLFTFCRTLPGKMAGSLWQRYKVCSSSIRAVWWGPQGETGKD